MKMEFLTIALMKSRASTFLKEKVSFEDLNSNGQLDLSYDEVIRQDGGSNTIKFDDHSYAINPVNGEFVLVDENFIDWNKNGVYDDADYASGGLHVRATFPNVWGFPQVVGV